MRTWFLALVALIAIVMTVPSYAAEPQVGSLNGRLLQPLFNPQGDAKPAAPNPFGTLFPPTTQRPPATQPELLPKRPLTDPTFTFASPLAPTKPRVLCGMVIIPVDPHLDPEFVREIPKDAPTGTMKVLPPPACEVNR